MGMDIRVLDSLQKVFADEELPAGGTAGVTALRGERVNFQVACRSTQVARMLVAARAQLPFSGEADLYDVGQAPVALPCYGQGDGQYLSTKPGLYPDPLFPHKGELRVLSGQWRCLWVSFVVPDDAPAGKSAVTVRLTAGEEQIEVSFPVEVVGAALPPQTLVHTEWFHADCLATWYGVEPLSEEHWTILGKYMKNAAAYGINLLLTPVFTPPLDTAVGGERPTVQLVDVTVRGREVRFGFDKLDRYMEMAEASGIQYFEISHLFTQWGATAAPKILADVDGEVKQIFGWDTDAASAEYTGFLKAFLEALQAHLRANDRLSRCYFHVSDEPSMDALESYGRAAAVVDEALGGECPVIDALSDYAFYEKGLVKHPIPANNHVDTFLDHGVEHLWTYYCCGQGGDVSNRFMAMPSARNRILGAQLFKYHIEGFLQWGYNFWYSMLSKRPIDPYAETGAEDAFPAGDAFLVYPGPDGEPVPSIRQLVFHEGLQDLRALQLLEQKLPHEAIVALLEQDGAVKFKEYPRTSQAVLAMRERVNRKIQELWG